MQSGIAERSNRRAALGQWERLEIRRLLAAHIVGNPAVFTDIQDAVQAAPAGATITVDAGVYNEMVKIDHPLTLLGARAGVDARDPSRGSGESVVRGDEFAPGVRTSGFYVTASDVTIDGFTVQDNTSSGSFGAGIVLGPSIAGSHVVNNIVRNNITGLYLSNNSATDAAVIQHNVFANNNNPGNNNGRGIYTDGGVSGGNLTNVLIDSNAFIGNVGDGTIAPNAEAAIGLEAQTAGKQSNITITNNTMTANGKGLLVFNAVGVVVQGNTITGSTDTVSGAIRIEGGVSVMTVTCNTIANNGGAGVRVVNKFTGPSSGVSVTMNNIAGNATGGLIVDAGAYTGALDATQNWWGSSFGPSGDGPGFGDLLQGNGAAIAFIPWSTTPSPCAPSLGLSALQTLNGVIGDLTAARGTVQDRDTGKKLDEILDKLSSAADPSLWQDGSHLFKKGGDRFFDQEKDTVNKLRDLLKNKKNSLTNDVLRGVIQRIVGSARLAANAALLDALDGDPKKLKDAQKELDKSDQSLGDDKFDDAIEHLKQAWKKALEANH